MSFNAEDLLFKGRSIFTSVKYAFKGRIVSTSSTTTSSTTTSSTTTMTTTTISSTSSSTSSSTTTIDQDVETKSYSTVPGTDVQNYQWSTTLANIGLDQNHIDGNVSKASTQNAILAIEARLETDPIVRSKSIESIFVNCYIKSDVLPSNYVGIRILTHGYWFPQEYPYDQQRITTSFKWISKNWIVNPYTGLPWTWEEIDTLKVGCTSISLGDISCDMIYLSVNYYK